MKKIAELRELYPMINDAIMEDIYGYVHVHQPVGGFLTAVLQNNLKESFGRADETNKRNLFFIVDLCYNHIPSECWGSVEAVKNWLSPRVERRASKTGGNYAGNKD